LLVHLSPIWRKSGKNLKGLKDNINLPMEINVVSRSCICTTFTAPKSSIFWSESIYRQNKDTNVLFCITFMWAFWEDNTYLPEGLNGQRIYFTRNIIYLSLNKKIIDGTYDFFYISFIDRFINKSIKLYTGILLSFPVKIQYAV